MDGGTQKIYTPTVDLWLIQVCKFGLFAFSQVGLHVRVEHRACIWFLAARIEPVASIPRPSTS